MTHKVPARKIAVGLAAIAVAASISVLARSPDPAQADPAETIALSESTDPSSTFLCLEIRPGVFIGIGCPPDSPEGPSAGPTDNPTGGSEGEPTDRTTGTPETPTTPGSPTSSPDPGGKSSEAPSAPGPSMTPPEDSSEPPEEKPPAAEETAPPGETTSPEETTPPSTTPPDGPSDDGPPPRTQQPQPNPAVPGPPQDSQSPEALEDDSDWDFRRPLPPDRDFSDPVPTRPFAGTDQPEAADDQEEPNEPEAQANLMISTPSLAQASMWLAFGVAGVLLVGAGWMNHRGRIDTT